MSRHEVERLVYREIYRISPYAREHLMMDETLISHVDNLCDLGLNSIDYAALVTGVMEQLSIRIPIVNFCNITRIADIVTAIYNELNSRQVTAGASISH